MREPGSKPTIVSYNGSSSLACFETIFFGGVRVFLFIHCSAVSCDSICSIVVVVVCMYLFCCYVWTNLRKINDGSKKWRND
jgi:hypothetical protein